jgi:hypothetical protein
MTDGGASAPISRRRTGALWARLLGLLSVVLFFVPLVAPLLQGGTFAYVLYAAWRGTLDRTSVIVGAAGSALGFLLYLATEYIWVV